MDRIPAGCMTVRPVEPINPMESHPMDPVKILRELIAIPSVNPMGRDVAGPEFLETRLTEHLENFFRELGVPFRAALSA